MRQKLLFSANLCLWLGMGQSLEMIPVDDVGDGTSIPIATGSATAKLVPFNLDYTAKPDWQSQQVLEKSQTSVWRSSVALYEDDQMFGSVISLSWPRGEGPGAPPVGNKQWNACVLALPDLLDQLDLSAKGPGDGSCADVVGAQCLAELTSSVSELWRTNLAKQETFSAGAVARTCGAFENVPIPSVCFGQSAQKVSSIKAYPRHNPANGKPFYFGLEQYGAGKDEKAATYQKAISRTWSMLVLEAQNDTAVLTTATCPSPGMGTFHDDFAIGTFSSWKTYGGSFDASSKALVAKSSAGGKAVIQSVVVDDFTYDADIKLPDGTTSGSAGLIFRVSDPANGANSYRGYYAGLESGNDKVVLGVADNNWKEIGSATFKVKGGGSWHIRIRAQGETIDVFVDDMDKAKMTVQDKSYTKGSAGVRVSNADAIFDNVDIKPLPHTKSVPSPDGTCGGMSRYTCSDTKVFFGNCCGADGVCGYSAESCGDGCQSQYGLCNTIVTVTASDKPTTTTSSSSIPSPTAQPTTTDGWRMMGCYKDLYPSTKRTLQDMKGLQDPLTIDSCRTQCFTQQYKYSGVENGKQCWCGNEIQDASQNIAVSMSECSTVCPGDSQQSCGAGARIVLSKYTLPAKSAWTTIGCYKDLYPAKDRILQEMEPASVVGKLTQQSCRYACAAKQYTYAGVENGSQCFCGDTIQSAADNSQVALFECSKACSGDTKDKCGDRARMLLSKLTPGTSSAWEPLGCYQDTFPTHARTLSDRIAWDGDLTLEKCQSQCLARGFAYSGMENGRECWCGNEVQSAGSNVLAALSECGKGCPGNSAQQCGDRGRIRLSRYSNPARKSWTSMGCYKDTAQPRALDERFDLGGKTTLKGCRSTCQNRGFKFAGVENGSECWCGNQIRETLSNAPTDMASCNKSCDGDGNQDCGAGGFIHVFRLASV